ncbi:hypothetical protein QBC42DRAFT_249059 [Cladorrhinum samala]|uniref:Uncharacterized protein n=1 Tax=Cladorrhinum samala TaxID=585594 RepID=A0AAV9HWH1_9PEZI|nr:hypothetical protein QBC42DRAFT_249059 [Cladorrhinum samala]
MDISSGIVSFRSTCPGSLMQDLLRDRPDQVRKITRFQTTFSSRRVIYECELPCEDLGTVYNFIKSIDALEELAVRNYEPDVSSLWQAIFHHAKSLRSLSIHTPPQVDEGFQTWTPASVAALNSELPSLQHLEMDISLTEAESFLDSPGDLTSLALIGAATQLAQPESILINIPLRDAASSFAGEHTWNVMGAIDFPEPKKQVCERFAVAMLDKFPAGAKKLQIRLTRRCWDDRFQYTTLGYSVTAVRDPEGKVTVETDKKWGYYLMAAPEYEGFLWKLMMKYRNEHGW